MKKPFNAIEETGALLGGCVAMTNGRRLNEIKEYKPTSPFGWWLKSLVDTEMERVKCELGRRKKL